MTYLATDAITHFDKSVVNPHVVGFKPVPVIAGAKNVHYGAMHPCNGFVNLINDMYHLTNVPTFHPTDGSSLSTLVLRYRELSLPFVCNMPDIDQHVCH